MAVVSDSELRTRADRRKAGLMPERALMEPDWREVEAYCSARKSRWLSGGTTATTGQGQRASRANNLSNPKLLDSRGIQAHDILTSGLQSGMNSPSRPWFRLKTEDDDLMEIQAVKDWLEIGQRRLYGLFARSNFYSASKSGYGQMGKYGIEATFMAQHPKMGAVCHALVAGQFWVGVGPTLEPDTLLRRCDMTTIQMVQRFGYKAVPQRVRDAFDKSEYDGMHVAWHLIEPNIDAEKGKYDKSNMPWRSLYWMDGDHKGGSPLLEFGGYEEQPFWAPRWDVEGAEAYGTSPGLRALPNLRNLQLKHLRRQQAIDYKVRPALKGPPQLANSRQATVPGGITYLAAQDDAAFKPIWEPNIDLSHLLEDIRDQRDTVDAAMYADMFNSITRLEGGDYKNMAHIASLNEEKLTQLGPVVERAQNEKQGVAIDRGFAILLRAGLLPPPPEELQGQELKVEYISVLAQMQRAVGLQSIESSLGFVGHVAGLYPAALDKVDFDQAIDEYADISGTPARMIRSDDAVAALRKSRAEAEAQEKNMAAAAAMAGPMKDGAQAARLLSETPTGNGGTMLQQVLGGQSA